MASYDCYLDFLEVMESEETCKALRAFFLKLIEVLNADEITYCFAGQLAFSHHSEPQSTKFFEVFIKRENKLKVLSQLPELSTFSVDVSTYNIPSEASPHTDYRFSIISLSEADICALEPEPTLSAFTINNLNVVSKNSLKRMVDLLSKSGVCSKIDMLYFEARLLYFADVAQGINHAKENADGWAWLQKKKLVEAQNKHKGKI